MSEVRAAVLAGVRSSLSVTRRPASESRPPILAARQPGEPQVEMDQLLREIRALGGSVRSLGAPAELARALADLVEAEGVKRATVWPTPDMADLGIPESLAELGVVLVSPFLGKQALAECDLGVTGVDMALPETGTLVLTSDDTRPRMVSLVPRVHLAIVRPGALRADLHQVFAEGKNRDYMIFVTGPSRTADIEMTLTIGVHGPKALHVWSLP